MDEVADRHHIMGCLSLTASNMGCLVKCLSKCLGSLPLTTNFLRERLGSLPLVPGCISLVLELVACVLERTTCGGADLKGRLKRCRVQPPG